MQLRKAERKKAKLRIGLSGPSGSGKTYSALRLARGIASDWTKIALIDSENGSGELYSSLGDYNVITLNPPYSPERYIEAIKTCEDAGMEVIVIDSTSHEWDGKGGCLEINDKLASAKFKGNTWAAWSETTPRHQKFIESIVGSKCHIITTARSKTDTIQTEDKKIKKVGTKEIQREGFEYELTANFTIDRDHHLAIASKDRTSLFIDRDPFLIDEKIGKEFLDWSSTGIDVEAFRRQEEERLFAKFSSNLALAKSLDELKEIFGEIYKIHANGEINDNLYDSLVQTKDAIKENFSAVEPKETEPVQETPKQDPVEVVTPSPAPTPKPQSKTETTPVSTHSTTETKVNPYDKVYDSYIAKVIEMQSVEDLDVLYMKFMAVSPYFSPDQITDFSAAYAAKKEEFIPTGIEETEGDNEAESTF